MSDIHDTTKTGVINHWYALIPGFNTSTQEFYAAVEAELQKRDVPGLDISRVDFNEGGGLLSARREYLRMTREHLVFDICAAPFGTAFFFSCRLVVIPTRINLWQLLLVVVATLSIIGLALNYAGLFFGSLLLVAGFGFLIYLLRNAIALGLSDLDAALAHSPIGTVYEAWFRTETYYTIDTRLMYDNTVNAVVKAKVEEVIGAKGIKFVRFDESGPELYKPRIVQPPAPPPAPAA